jgi:hypothetical protein
MAVGLKTSFSVFKKMSNMLCIMMVLIWMTPFSAFSIDFSSSTDTGQLIYRFTPNTGTLNDLKVIFQEGFQFYPSFFGGITRFSLGGEALHPWEGKHTSMLVEEKYFEAIYQAKFRWGYRGDHFEFTIKIWLNGQTLCVEFFTDPLNQNVMEFGCDRSEATPEPKVIQLPYGHNVLFSNGIFVSAIMDHFRSNASTIIPLHFYHSDTSAGYGNEAYYHSRTDGSRNSLLEKIQISVSADMDEVFFQPRNPVSPYRYFLIDKVIVDLWRIQFKHCRDDLQQLANLGMKDLLAIIHVWQKYGYDNGLPTTYPAGDLYGGEAGLLEVRQLCESENYLFALHTNYVDFYENSEVWNEGDVALNPDGSRVKAWYNSSTGIQSYLLKPSRVLDYANMYEPLIHDAYQTNSSFLDVHSSVLPSYKVDYDAGIDDSGKQISTFEYHKELIDYFRIIHEGPVLGEGFGPATMIWSGYIDAVEADPRSEHSRGGTDVPLIVDYKLKHLNPLFVPHGVGYLQRFYLDKWTGYSVSELERYRLTEMAFGNAGFIHNPFAKNISINEVLMDYCLLKHMQQYYLRETPSAIYYWINDQLFTLSDALRRILPSLSSGDLQQNLTEKLSRLKIEYSDGFVLFINRSISTNWKIQEQSATYILPPNGFLARKGNEFLAYLAVIDGSKKYYMFPKEPACCRVISPEVHFSGEKILNSSLLQYEYINVLNWQTFPGNTQIEKCKIYQVEGDSWELLVELDSKTHEYRHQPVKKEKTYTYALVVVHKKSGDGTPIFLTVK